MSGVALSYANRRFIFYIDSTRQIHIPCTGKAIVPVTQVSQVNIHICRSSCHMHFCTDTNSCYYKYTCFLDICTYVHICTWLSVVIRFTKGIVHSHLTFQLDSTYGYARVPKFMNKYTARHGVNCNRFLNNCNSIVMLQSQSNTLLK